MPAQIDNLLDATLYTQKISPNVRKAMLEFTGRECLLVRHRRKGKTGSGELLNCHDNVKNWVDRFGGEQVYGWVLHRNKKLIGLGAYIWNFHSIWKTPEGKYADVTMNPTYDDSDYITFWPDASRKFDWENMISFNMLEVYENASIAANVSRNTKNDIKHGIIYWANNGYYIALSDDDGTYKMLNEERENEICKVFGLSITHTDNGKKNLSGTAKLTNEQKKTLCMKYSVSMQPN
jgi:hypothetical protein